MVIYVAGNEKHGYRAAIIAQIEHGIFAYCGLRDIETRLLLNVENADGAVRAAHLHTAYTVGRSVFATRGTGADRLPSLSVS